MTNTFQYTYEVVPVWNTLPNADTNNFEVYFHRPLRGTRVPLGSTTTTLISGEERTDGAKLIELTTDACTFSELSAYVTAIFGGFDTENVNVTLRTRKRANTFAYYNAIAYLPLDQNDYEHVTTRDLQNVKLRFRILSVASV